MSKVSRNAVSGNGNGNDNDNNNNKITKDDDYYLSLGSEPSRFLYYQHVRAQEWQVLRHEPWYDVYDRRITQDELDFILKRELRISPEERYQHRKGNWFFHDLSYLNQTVDEDDKTVDIIKEYGCGHWSNKREEGCCVPECRYYFTNGRFEDDEVIEEHNKLVRDLTEENVIVQPPDINSEEAHTFFLERYSSM